MLGLLRIFILIHFRMEARYFFLELFKIDFFFYAIILEIGIHEENTRPFVKNFSAFFTPFFQSGKTVFNLFQDFTEIDDLVVFIQVFMNSKFAKLFISM